MPVFIAFGIIVGNLGHGSDPRRANAATKRWYNNLARGSQLTAECDDEVNGSGLS